jgi:hypothetical protein
MRTVHDVIDRLRAEYLEVPGLRLTPKQVERLCGIERLMCHAVLDALVASQFLCVKPEGHYVRLTDGTIPRPHPAKAHLTTATSSKTVS